jgi:hypothetical protein
MSIDAANPGDKTSIMKESEILKLKNKDFITEIERMWNVRAKVIPLTTVATGTISKSFRQYLSNVTE